MKKYKLDLVVQVVQPYEIEAASKDEAELKALEKFKMSNIVIAPYIDEYQSYAKFII